MNNKKRILWISEGNGLNTGFANITMGMLSRLFATNKYDILEIATYTKTSDPRHLNVPWDIIGSIPEDNDIVGQQQYNSDINAQFGKLVFPHACLKFKPHIVVQQMDCHMCSWIEDSPYRKHVKIIYQPPLDAEPLRPEYLWFCDQVDLFLSQAEYGKRVLENGYMKTPVFDVTRPAVDHHVFKPLNNKKDLRKHFGLPEDAKIILTTMRNQQRKLFADLIDAFGEYIRLCVNNNNKILAEKTYLHLHTSYPDVGFDIGRLIMESGLGHRIIVTYRCAACGNFYPDFFQGERSVCKNCKNLALHMPNTQHGLTREDMCLIYNNADCYIQYATNEGLCMPIAEAKACGLPALAVDYSAMSEQVKCDGCFPINVERFFYESVTELERLRALPDNKDAAKKLFNLLSLSDNTIKSYGALARKDAVENYSYDRAAKIFEKAIDSLEINDSWNAQPNFLSMPRGDLNFSNNKEMLDFMISEVLKQPNLKNSPWRANVLKALNVGYMSDRNGFGRQAFDANACYQMFSNRVMENNFWENQRNLLNKKNHKEEMSWQII